MSVALPLVVIALSVVLLMKLRWRRQLLAPVFVIAILVAVWQLAVTFVMSETNPTPGQTFSALASIFTSDQLWKHSAASLFRVTWGFVLATALAVPLGLFVGWNTRGFEALNPIIQAMRPISPIAWIPFAILWFGIGDRAGIFLILYASFFPITVGTMAAVRNISRVHQRSAENFGLSGLELFRRVVLPAALPQIITSLRIALGVAWLVIVAAEMVGMDSGLGYLINDARNMGRRYDLVAATMILIGLIGVVLDFLVRKLEGFDEVKWGYVNR